MSNQIDKTAFMQRLASSLGADFVPDREGHTGEFSMPRVKLPNGLMVNARLGYGVKAGSIELSVYHPGADYNRGIKATFPTATVNASRPWETLVRDVQRRLVQPSDAPCKEIEAQIAALEDRKASLSHHVDAFRALSPLVSITTKPGEDFADFYLNVTGKGYVYGTVHHDGHLNIQRCAVDGHKRALAVIAAILAGEA